MKYKHRLIHLFALSLTLLGMSCEDRRMNNMIEDKVYLNNFGENEVKVFKWDNFTYQLPVIKSGVGQQGGEVTLGVDEAALASYGDKYTLLPAELYKIKTTQISFGKGDYSLPFEIEFNAAGIETLQSTTELVYALPLKLTSGTIAAAAEHQLYSVLVPKVFNPYIEFKTAGLFPTTSGVSTALSPDEPRFYAFLQTNYDNKTDLSYKVEVDAAALTAYNLAQGTSYKLLPAEGYKLDASTFVIANLNNEQALSYYLIKGKVPNGEYMLPLKIVSVSKYAINPAKSTMFIPVKFED